MLALSIKASARGFALRFARPRLNSKAFPGGNGIGGILLGLFQAFSLRCAQIDEAIRRGDDARVNRLDYSIVMLIDAIVAYKANDPLEVHMQLQFVSCLIDQYADDSDTVREYVTLLSNLMEQYFASPVPRWQMPARDGQPAAQPDGYVPNTDNGNFLNAAILEGLPDRVAVLTKDYRYLYSNTANSAYLGKKPIEMIGRHIIEFIGEARFTDGAKARLDDCFAGQSVAYSYDRNDGATVRQVRCRMSPLRDASASVFGALIMLEDIGTRQATRAA